MVSLNLGIVTTITPSGKSLELSELASSSAVSSVLATAASADASFSALPFNASEMSSPSSPIIAKS